MHKVWCCSEQVPYCSRSSVKFQGHTAQKIDFDPNWPFLDCNSILNSPMAMKWCTKLEETSKRYPIVFRSHSSNFNVTWEKIAQIGRIRTVTPVWIHRWLWGIEEVLLFFNVIVQISRSQRTKKCWFQPKLRISGLQLQFEFTDGFQMMHTAWRSIEEVPYCFWRSSIKFRGHTGKNWWFEANLSKITRPVAAIKSRTFALFCINNIIFLAICRRRWEGT